MKYIIVTGGVVSGLGKGITISSMGRLLQSCGLNVTAIKIDPYLNVDAGTMSPFEHGEVFVLNDGGESDLDLGNYERFLNIQLTSQHNITTGKIYSKVISAERKGNYLGKTVQVVPHITDCIQEWIENVAMIPIDEHGTIADICLIEVGGTVGDIESSVFLEALRQFQFRVGVINFCLCFVSLIPCLSDEQKTKPTQHGVRDLRSLGLSPTIIFCRSTTQLHDCAKTKISSFCHVPVTNVISVHDISNTYHVPALLESQDLHIILQSALQLNHNNNNDNNSIPLVPSLKSWTDMAESIDNAQQVVKIALIGKYTGLQDSYLSVIRALGHASIACHVRLQLEWIEATLLEKPSESTDTNGYNNNERRRNSPTNGSNNNVEENSTNGNHKDTKNNFNSSNSNDVMTPEELYDDAWKRLHNADGVIVPGGFGTRGWEGKILAINYCRLNNKPVLGVCLGFQAMVVEYARTVLKLNDADSIEFNEQTLNPIVIFMPEIDKETMGGTMRLGERGTQFTHNELPDKSTSICYQLYNSNIINERHRHRYEVNPAVVDKIHDSGLYFVGRDNDTKERMEIVELSRNIHPYYVGCQFHPEFKSRPLLPSPPFHGLILASIGKLNDYLLQHKEN